MKISIKIALVKVAKMKTIILMISKIKMFKMK
jgi:hypothetical protein